MPGSGGGWIVEAAVIPATDRTALVVVGYDRRIRGDGTIRRLHQEDFAQANSMYPTQKYKRGTLPGLAMTGLLSTAKHLPPGEALKLPDQVIFNILVANTDAPAKNYSMLLSGEPAVAPLHDVSTVLPWDHVNRYHARNPAGRKRNPGDMARRHRERIAQEAGPGARGVRLRARELADAMVAHRVAATQAVASQPGATPVVVAPVASLSGRLIKTERSGLFRRLHPPTRPRTGP